LLRSVLDPACQPASNGGRRLLTPETLRGIALLAAGVLVGALAFSTFIGRYRARQLAHLVDRLALLQGATGPDPVRYPDPVLRGAMERLATRIAVVEGMATTDVLTGVLNRQACLRLLATEIERSNRYGRPIAVALIDIDHFKRVNDTHGHAVGDEVLTHVAQALASNVRAADSVGRYGGEEFLLVMPETDPDAGAASAEHLRRLIAGATVPTLAGELEVTISAGVAGGTGTASIDIDKLLRAADAAMYTAKSLGRDQVQVFRPVDDEAAIAKAPISAAARMRATLIGRAAFEAANAELLESISGRPGWAGGPSRLIAELASEVARSAGLPDGDIHRIKTASLLHDLGKLAIPDQILDKPGGLTKNEWRVVVEHPKIGQIILEQAGAVRDAASIVLHHHEWFNGQGYPHGLAGAEIPIGSRIVAIADAYEAMLSNRPYKPSMTHEQALAELRRQRGTQFDPDLVDMFVDLYASGTSAVRLSSARRIRRSVRSATPG
jgi:diguanylate cyclase (GGDEF)-like protein